MADGSLRWRIGAFSVSAEVVYANPDALVALLEGCAVVRAETVWHTRMIEYVALHPDFDEVPENSEVPCYGRLFTRHPDGSITEEWKRL